MSDDPREPLTPTEQEIVGYVARGWGSARIAEWLGITPSTVRVHVYHVAGKLHNPDRLKAWELVFLFAAHRAWLADHVSKREHEDAA